MVSQESYTWVEISPVTHRLAEARSLALHVEVAWRLRLRPEVLDAARRRVEEWLVTGAVPRYWARQWSDLLAGSADVVIAAITDAGEHARALRQASPFARVLDPRTRWSILRGCREEAVAR